MQCIVGVLSSGLRGLLDNLVLRDENVRSCLESRQGIELKNFEVVESQLVWWVTNVKLAAIVMFGHIGETE